MEFAVLYYLIGINLIAVIVMGIDKFKAIKGKWRISEMTLLSLGVIGGALGVIYGILIFKHKLSKKYFTVLMPLVLTIQIILGLFLFFK